MATKIDYRAVEGLLRANPYNTVCITAAGYTLIGKTWRDQLRAIVYGPGDMTDRSLVGWELAFHNSNDPAFDEVYNDAKAHGLAILCARANCGSALKRLRAQKVFTGYLGKRVVAQLYE